MRNVALVRDVWFQEFCPRLRTTALGSEPEGQEFFRTEAKPPCSFWDRALAPLMTDDGWIAEWQVLNEASAKVEAKRTVCGVPVLHALGTTPRAK